VQSPTAFKTYFTIWYTDRDPQRILFCGLFSFALVTLNIFLLLRKLKNKLIKLEIVAEARMLTVGLTRRTDAIEFHHGCGVTNF